MRRNLAAICLVGLVVCVFICGYVHWRINTTLPGIGVDGVPVVNRIQNQMGMVDKCVMFKVASLESVTVKLLGSGYSEIKSDALYSEWYYVRQDNGMFINGRDDVIGFHIKSQSDVDNIIDNHLFLYDAAPKVGDHIVVEMQYRNHILRKFWDYIVRITRLG